MKLLLLATIKFIFVVNSQCLLFIPEDRDGGQINFPNFEYFPFVICQQS